MHEPALGCNAEHRGDAEALEAGSLAARPLGRVLRSINGANELWLAVALSAEPCQNLPPPLLAAVAAALVAPEVRAGSDVAAHTSQRRSFMRYAASSAFSWQTR